MAHWPDHMDATEAAICNKTLTRILSNPRHLMVRVFDGEEWATGWTRDRAAIQRETAATDETRWFLTETETAEGGAGRRIGSILLIHGNGEDVISDTSWNPRVSHAQELLDQLTGLEE